MAGARITYTPRSDATPKGELTALASVYAYLLKNCDSKKAAKDSQPGGPDNAEDLENDRIAVEPTISE